MRCGSTSRSRPTLRSNSSSAADHTAARRGIWYINSTCRTDPQSGHNRPIHLVIDCVVDPWVEAMFTAVTARRLLEDDAFLYELFKAVRMPEFAHVTMAPAQLECHADPAQRATHSYASQYPFAVTISFCYRAPDCASGSTVMEEHSRWISPLLAIAIAA